MLWLSIERLGLKVYCCGSLLSDRIFLKVCCCGSLLSDRIFLKFTVVVLY